MKQKILNLFSDNLSSNITPSDMRIFINAIFDEKQNNIKIINDASNMVFLDNPIQENDILIIKEENNLNNRNGIYKSLKDNPLFNDLDPVIQDDYTIAELLKSGEDNQILATINNELHWIDQKPGYFIKGRIPIQEILNTRPLNIGTIFIALDTNKDVSIPGDAGDAYSWDGQTWSNIGPLSGDSSSGDSSSGSSENNGTVIVEGVLDYDQKEVGYLDIEEDFICNGTDAYEDGIGVTVGEIGNGFELLTVNGDGSTEYESISPVYETPFGFDHYNVVKRPGVDEYYTCVSVQAGEVSELEIHFWDTYDYEWNDVIVPSIRTYNDIHLYTRVYLADSNILIIATYEEDNGTFYLDSLDLNNIAAGMSNILSTTDYNSSFMNALRFHKGDTSRDFFITSKSNSNTLVTRHIDLDNGIDPTIDTGNALVEVVPIITYNPNVSKFVCLGVASSTGGAVQLWTMDPDGSNIETIEEYDESDPYGYFMFNDGNRVVFGGGNTNMSYRIQSVSLEKIANTAIKSKLVEDQPHAPGKENSITLSEHVGEDHSDGAIGKNSFTQGKGTLAPNDNQVALGQHNVGDSTETILEVGIGESYGEEANGLEVRKDGTVRLPESTGENIGSHPQNVTTVEYVEEQSIKTDSLSLRYTNYTNDFGEPTFTQYNSIVVGDFDFQNDNNIYAGYSNIVGRCESSEYSVVFDKANLIGSFDNIDSIENSSVVGEANVTDVYDSTISGLLQGFNDNPVSRGVYSSIIAGSAFDRDDKLNDEPIGGGIIVGDIHNITAGFSGLLTGVLGTTSNQYDMAMNGFSNADGPFLNQHRTGKGMIVYQTDDNTPILRNWYISPDSIARVKGSITAKDISSQDVFIADVEAIIAVDQNSNITIKQNIITEVINDFGTVDVDIISSISGGSETYPAIAFQLTGEAGTDIRWTIGFDYTSTSTSTREDMFYYQYSSSGGVS